MISFLEEAYSPQQKVKCCLRSTGYTTAKSKKYYAPINVKPQGGRGYTQEIDIGSDFEHKRCPNYLTFRASYPRG